MRSRRFPANGPQWTTAKGRRFEVAEQEVMQVVTANRLRDGIPVYFAGGTRWSPSIDEAALADAAGAQALLAAAGSGPTENPVVGSCLIETRIVAVPAAARRIEPISLRERIRAHGPTV